MKKENKKLFSYQAVRWERDKRYQRKLHAHHQKIENLLSLIVVGLKREGRRVEKKIRGEIEVLGVFQGGSMGIASFLNPQNRPKYPYTKKDTSSKL